MKGISLVTLLLVFHAPAMAEEVGTGKPNNTSDATPTDPIETEANGGFLEQLLEWFDMDVES